MASQEPGLFARARLGRTIGLTLLAIGLLQYRSWESTAVFGRWSKPFFAVVVFVGALALLSFLRSWQMARRAAPAEGAARPDPGPVLDLALLCFGAAYLITALDEPARAGRLTELDLAGSLHPLAAMLEWFFLVFALAWALMWLFRWIGGRAKPVVMVLGSVFGTLLLAEGLARVYAQIAPEPQGLPTFSGKLWLRRNTELNGDGFRDVEHEEAAAPGTRRFVVIGDSIAFGVGVEDRSERVGEVLARSLAAQGKKVEAFSAALADTHTLDHIQFLKRTQRYEPELVILLYFFNDIDYMASVTDRIAVPRGYLAQRLHPKLFLFRNSYLFNELFVRVRGLAFRTGQKQTADLPPDPYLDDALLARHLDDLKSFVDLARQGGARAVVVPFDLRTVLGEPHLGRCLRLVAEATKRGIPVIDPSSAFKGHDFASITANPRDSHPNGKGHGLVAAYLAEHLGWPN